VHAQTSEWYLARLYLSTKLRKTVFEKKPGGSGCCWDDDCKATRFDCAAGYPDLRQLALPMPRRAWNGPFVHRVVE
jgi:hypothetical protein